MSIPIIVSLLGSSAILAVAFSFYRRECINSFRIRLITIRAGFLQLVATDVISKHGDLYFVLNKATKISIDRINGMTLWDLAQKPRAALPPKVEGMLAELAGSQKDVQDLALMYLNTEMQIILYNSPVLMVCIKIVTPCAKMARAVKHALLPKVISRRYKAYTYMAGLSQRLPGPVHHHDEPVHLALA